jgi:hypothetical protein
MSAEEERARIMAIVQAYIDLWEGYKDAILDRMAKEFDRDCVDWMESASIKIDQLEWLLSDIVTAEPTQLMKYQEMYAPSDEGTP